MLLSECWTRSWTDWASVSAEPSTWTPITVKPPSRLVHAIIFLCISNSPIKLAQVLWCLVLPQPLSTLTMLPAFYPELSWSRPTHIFLELLLMFWRWKNMNTYPTVRFNRCCFNTMTVFDRLEWEQMDSRRFFWKTPHSSTTKTGSPRWGKPSKL